nr:MAG TPA: hypothetical protein [Caudoviricetes sp.]DAY95478.1 MAG TPA: hypothetical protein [Caudoviricetes sp.]
MFVTRRLKHAGQFYIQFLIFYRSMFYIKKRFNCLCFAVIVML